MADPFASWDPAEATPHADGKPDVAIVPYVDALRDAGIVTLQSCSGHNEDGILTDGHLVWVADGHLDPDDLASSRFHVVRKEYKRYRAPAWEVNFRGMTVGEGQLKKDMEALFRALGIEATDSTGVV